MTLQGTGAPEAERREAILRLTRRCTAESDPKRVLRTLLEGAVELLEADDGGIAGWDEAKGELRQVESFLPSENVGTRHDLDRSASGRAARTIPPGPRSTESMARPGRSWYSGSGPMRVKSRSGAGRSKGASTTF